MEFTKSQISEFFSTFLSSEGRFNTLVGVIRDLEWWDKKERSQVFRKALHHPLLAKLFKISIVLGKIHRHIAIIASVAFIANM